jgi:CDP-diacylglycerol--serine O-phosphatidyltransferase
MTRTRPRRRMRKAVIVVPSLFTLANLFFGMWAIVLALTGDFYKASWWIVIAGILDVLDGSFARMSKTGSRFGAELDSLADLVSFGVAPAVLLYALHFSHQGPFAWLFLYGFVVCVALRLARYNVQTDDHPVNQPRAKFTGLPTTAAGMTLGVYYPFTLTDFYQDRLAGLPWNIMLIFLIIALSLAMVSTVEYARLPGVGFRTRRGRLGFPLHFTILGFGIWSRDIFFFPFGIAYLLYGLVRAVVMAQAEATGDDAEEAEEAEGHVPFVVRGGRGSGKRRPPAAGE